MLKYTFFVCFFVVSPLFAVDVDLNKIRDASGLIHDADNKQTIEYCEQLSTTGESFYSAGKFAEAENCFIQAYDITSRKYTNHWVHGLTCHNLGEVHRIQGKYDEAIEYLEKAIKVEYWDRALSHKCMGTLYKDVGELARSLTHYNNALDIYLKKHGDRSIKFLEIHVAISLVLSNMGNNEEALKRFKRNMPIMEEVAGKRSKDYAFYLLNYSTILYINGMKRQALAFMLEATEIYESYGSNSLSLATFYNNLGVITSELNEPQKSLDFALKSYNLFKNYYKPPHIELANALNNIGMAYRKTGDYKQTLNYLNQSAQMYSEVYSKHHEVFLQTKFNIAVVYDNIGNYKKSEQILKECQYYINKHYNEKSPLYLNYLLYKSNSLSNNGKYEKALSLVEKFFKSYDHIYTEQNTAYIAMKQNLAFLYDQTGNRNKSKRTLLDTVKEYEKTINKPDEKLAELYSSLGSYYLGFKKWNKSIEYNLKSIEIYTDLFGDSYFKIADCYNKLAFAYLRQGALSDYGKASKQMMDIYKNHITTNFMFLSETELQTFIDFNYEIAHQNILFTPREYIKDKSLITELQCNSLIFYKGLTLLRSNILNEYIKTSGNKELQQHYNQLLDTRAIFQEFNKSELNNTIKYDSLKNAVSNLEDEIFIQFKGYEDYGKQIAVSFNNIKEILKSNQVVIEIGEIKIHENGKNEDKYVAYLIFADSEYPVFVELCATSEIKEALKKIDNEHDLSNKTNLINSLYNIELYNLIWKNIENKLQGKDEIFISPYGALNRVNFAAIKDAQNKIVAEKMNIKVLFSTKILTTHFTEITLEKTDKISLWGGINYSATTEELLASSHSYTSSSNLNDLSLITYHTRDITDVIYLPGTLSEILNIEKKVSRVSSNVVTFKDVSATEFSFKSFSGNAPEFIHVATHGFYLPIEEKPKIEQGKVEFTREFSTISGSDFIPEFENPLERTGLLFSGFQTLKNIDNINNFGDGVITASEIANMNLEGNKLSVLSACETGLGYDKGAEGVFGLQRAFKIAGSKYIIMALWSVPDKETAEFMDLFYSYLINNKDIESSFNLAQQKLKENYPPYFWAGFILKR